MRFVLALTLMGLASCAPQHEYHAFVGCWQSEDGLAIESWTQDPSDWLFGYALNRDEDGEVKFFEQMRFDGEYLTVIGDNDDTTRFKRVESDSDYVFENPDHDFPQRITYKPSFMRLDAEISKLDGSEKIEFKKSRCEGT